MQLPMPSNPLLRETSTLRIAMSGRAPFGDPSRERVGSFIHQHAIRGAGNVESATVLSPEFDFLLEVVECVICQKLTNHADGMMLFEGSRHLPASPEAPINKSAEVPGQFRLHLSTSSSSSPFSHRFADQRSPPYREHPPRTTLEKPPKQKKT